MYKNEQSYIVNTDYDQLALSLSRVLHSLQNAICIDNSYYRVELYEKLYTEVRWILDKVQDEMRALNNEKIKRN